jgi:drug/metabolite transporter (DMT)-like permease
MSTTLIATFAGLVAAFMWGTSDWLAAKSAKKLHPVEVNFAVQAASFVLVLVLFCFSGLHVTHLRQVGLIALSSILISLAFMLIVKALASGAVGVISPLANSYPLFTIVLSLIFLTTHFKTVELVAIFGILAGTLLLAYEKNTRDIPFRELHRETGLALCASAVWGTAFFVIAPVVNEVSWQTITILGEVFSFGFASLLLFAHSRRKTPRAMWQALQSKPSLLTGILGTTGIGAIYIGSGRVGSVVIPTVLSGGGPLIASAWGAAADKERIGIPKRLGALIVVAGIIILNIA